MEQNGCGRWGSGVTARRPTWQVHDMRYMARRPRTPDAPREDGGSREYSWSTRRSAFFAEYSGSSSSPASPEPALAAAGRLKESVASPPRPAPPRMGFQTLIL